jgi:hypothetical protein
MDSLKPDCVCPLQRKRPQSLALACGTTVSPVRFETKNRRIAAISRDFQRKVLNAILGPRWFCHCACGWTKGPAKLCPQLELSPPTSCARSLPQSRLRFSGQAPRAEACEPPGLVPRIPMVEHQRNVLQCGSSCPPRGRALGTSCTRDAQQGPTQEYVALEGKGLPSLRIHPFPRKAHLAAGCISRDSATELP